MTASALRQIALAAGTTNDRSSKVEAPSFAGPAKQTGAGRARGGLVRTHGTRCVRAVPSGTPANTTSLIA